MSESNYASDMCEPMFEGPDGWSEWIHPLPGYRIQCCDCDLIHDMEFKVVPADPDDGPFNEGEGTHGVIIFRARRAKTQPIQHGKVGS